MSKDYKYPGEELQLFEKATNWKNYFASHISVFLKGRVLEVGAGIGGTTLLLNKGNADNWLLLEPDETMWQTLQQKINDNILPSNCRAVQGTLNSVDKNEKFDCIIYIDVLEHIENDAAELKKATDLLVQGGYLIILSPAFQFLFSPFDKAIGHYRRYNRKTLSAIQPASLTKRKVTYLDSIGFFASLLNKILLRQSYPAKKQVQLWDQWMIPMSKITDRIFFYSFGKSILAVWKKQ
ncbi:MAG: class I SAM-dependent methyltransferase [Chitinophagales bacterium]|nr:class I SAM-dependent methyltransferase [Chitinophagales bacterium]